MIGGRWIARRILLGLSWGAWAIPNATLPAQSGDPTAIIDLEADLALDPPGVDRLALPDPGVPEEAFVLPPTAPRQLPRGLPAAAPPLNLPPPQSVAAVPPLELPDMLPTRFVGPVDGSRRPTSLLVDETLSGDEPLTLNLLDSFIDFLSPTDPGGRDNFQLNVGTGVGYDSNVLFSAVNRVKSETATAFAVASYAVGLPRFSLESSLTLRTTYYQNRPGGKRDDSYSLRLGAAYQVRPRLSATFSTVTAYQSLPSSTQVGGVFFFTGPYFSTDTFFDLSYEVRPRLSLDFGYLANTVQYDNELINQQSGFLSQSFSLTVNYLVAPRSTLLLQYRFNPLTFPEADQASTGQILTVGLSQQISPRFSWMLQLGGEFRSIENPPENTDAPTEYAGPFAEGELTYQSRPNTRIAGTLRFGTEPSGVAGITIRQTFRVELSVEHDFGQRLTSELGVNYQNDYFDLPGEESDYGQTIYTGFLTMRYQHNKSLGTFVRLDYLQLVSQLPMIDFDRYLFTMGVDVTF